MRTWKLLAALSVVSPLAGCGTSTTIQMTPTSVTKTPDAVLEPKAIDEAPAKKDAPETKSDDQAGPAVEVKDLTAEATASPAPAPAAEIALTPMKFAEYRSKAVVDPKAKLIVVDAWATWCPPCMENFPHLVEMHRKYADQGLTCVSLSLDPPDDPKSVAEARKFLQAQKATFLNVLMDEDQGDAFDQLDVNGIPAVFLFDPSGKEVRRFTMDDPNRQFTYQQVDEVIGKLLKGETLPDDAPGEVYKPRSK